MNELLALKLNERSRKWDAGNGPAKDAYNIGDNPQFSLQVHGKGVVWLLLTRHITNIDDFRDNKEYIALLVYKNEGKHVYYPCECHFFFLYISRLV